MLVVVDSTCDDCILSVIREEMLIQMQLEKHSCEERHWESFWEIFLFFESKGFCLLNKM